FTIVFNLARLYEDMHRLQDARRLYLSLLQRHPLYIDCYMRLAILANNDGATAEADRWLKFASTLRPDDYTPYALSGYFHLKREEWKQAQERFEQLQRMVKERSEP